MRSQETRVSVGRVPSLVPVLVLVLAIAGCGGSAPNASPPAVTPQTRAAEAQTPASRLRALFDQAWEQTLKDSPITASYLGDPRYNDRWDDLSPAAVAAHKARDREWLAQIQAFDRASLPANEQLNYDLFRRDLEDRVAGQAFGGELMPLTQLDGVQLLGQLAEFLPFETQKDYENWLARLQTFDTLVDQTIALMRTGIEQKRVRPRYAMQRVLPQIGAQLGGRAQESPFYVPFQRYPDAVTADVRAQLDVAAQAAIQDTVTPALMRLRDFLDKDYLPACPEDAIGISAQPEGAAYYAWLVRHHTTTDLTPQQIHDIGLAEVERLQAEMKTVMREAGHSGSAARFQEKLRWNPRYQYRDATQLLDAYRALAKRIDPELPRLFGKLPRTPYGVRPIADVSAPSAPAAYYYPPSADGRRPGYFYANTWRPETRAGWEMEALTAHEAVPGHHLQIALANELEGVPAFRRQGLELTAFVEGWGLYAESLGREIGLYQDAGSRFGRLNFEMWRAVRLVVDTGLHAKGWSRRQAREFMAAHAPKSEAEIGVEVDRYLAMPGQALAYKIGELKIQELRRRAQQALGPRFDLRGFHDTVLGQGALPLDLLERQVDAWIAAQGASAPTPVADAPDPG